MPAAAADRSAAHGAQITGELRAGSRPLAACIAGVFLGTLPSYAIGAFLEPVATDLRLSMPQVLGWSLCWSVGIICAAPVVGFAADRHGARPVALIALVALAAALAWTAWAAAGPVSWCIGGLLTGAAAAGVGGVTFGRIVTSLFDRGLGSALGLMSAGVGLSAILGPRLLQAGVDAWGWRVALAAEVAVIAGMLPLLAAWLPRRSERSSSAAAEGQNLSEAMRRPVFWLMAGGTFVYGVCVAGLSVNLMPFLATQGLARSTAAEAAGLFGAASLAGRLLTGVMIDRSPLHASVIIALMLVAEAAAFAMLGLTGVAMLVPALLVFGFAVGAEGDCLAFLVARFFGRRYFSRIFGLLGIAALYAGTGSGPLLFDVATRRLGSYPSALMLWAALAGAAALLFAVTARATFHAAARR